MNFFLDTEFNEQPNRVLDLISVGMVNEWGDEFYAIDRRYLDGTHPPVNDFVRLQVLPHLARDEAFVGNPYQIATKLLAFVNVEQPRDITMWGYYSDYDWVVLMQLFGDMSAHPEGWPYYCRDLRQWLDDRNRQHLTQPEGSLHNALDDARWVAATYDKVLRDEAAAYIPDRPYRQYTDEELHGMSNDAFQWRSWSEVDAIHEEFQARESEARELQQPLG